MRSAVLLLLIAGVAYSLVVGYHVEPQTAAQSGWTHRGDSVAQVITINFDELDSTAGAYCELFAGTQAGGGQYNLSVLTYPGGSPIAYPAYANGNVDHKWVRFYLHVTRPDSVVKGKKLAFCFTRGATVPGDSFQYYYDINAYDYGQMIVPDPPPGITARTGLAMRCYGRMKAIDSTYWTMDGAQPVCWWDSDWTLRDTWKERLDSSGVGAIRFEIKWPQIQTGLHRFNFDTLDTNLLLLKKAGLGAFVLFDLTAESTSTRFDDTANTLFWSQLCPPRGLSYPPESDSNYWARFLDTVVKHCDAVLDSEHEFHAFEIWNEPNDTGVTDTTQWRGNPNYGYWRRPNQRDYTGRYEGMPGMCSLYVRLCDVAAAVIRGIPGHETDTILVGSMAGMNWSGPPWIKGSDWIRTVYDIAGTSVPWTGVSLHPHQAGGLDEFDPGRYEANCDTVRAIMGNKVGVIWNTEIGWATADRSQDAEECNARSLCKTYVTSRASEARPQGGYDRANWWVFRERFKAPRLCGYFPLWDSAMTTPYMSFYACRQMTQALTGERLNGRVMSGDTAIDDHTRVYEFEDTTALKKRTWVCWQDEAVSAYTPVPVRSDTVDTVALAYNTSPPTNKKNAENSGWLHIALDPRPAFVTEKSAASRPELVADSFWTVPERPYANVPMTF